MKLRVPIFTADSGSDHRLHRAETGYRLRPRTALSILLVVGAMALRTPVSAVNGGGQRLGGADVFLRYCAGCHGFDGFAEYPFAPSFSMGERLHKSDDALLHSILGGRHAMPDWEHKLSIDMLRSAISYLRLMAQRFDAGMPPRQQPLPGMYYRFNPVGEDEGYWENSGW